MTRTALIGLVLVTATLTARGPADDNLAAGFADPPDSAKSWVYWWWLNGYATKDGILRDLDAMKRLGISGALVFHAGSGPDAQADGIHERLLAGTVHGSRWRRPAKRRIEIGLNVCAGWNAGWPLGGAGQRRQDAGPWDDTFEWSDGLRRRAPQACWCGRDLP